MADAVALDDDFEPFTGEISPTVGALVNLPDDVNVAVDVDEDAAVSGLPGVYKIAGARRGIQLNDLTDCEEFSTVEFSLASDFTAPREAFSYSRAQCVAGSNRVATGADTSLHRAGSYGLPQGWAGYVFGWRARVSAPPSVLASDAFRRWTDTVEVTFGYSMKTYAKLPLSELLCVPKSLVGAAMPATIATLTPGQMSIPVHLRENLSFVVQVVPQDYATCDALRREMLDAAGVDDRHKLMFAMLDGQVSTEIMRQVARMLTPQPLLIRVYLRGWWLRSVV